MSKEDADAQRIIELETKISYQDKTIDELNDALIDMNKTVADLARRLSAVERVIRTDVERRDVPNEAPPHY
jgi:uncharacterized coiled-coil protein SlyX